MWIPLSLTIGSMLATVVSSSTVVDIQSVRSEFKPDIIKNVTVGLLTLNGRHVVNGSIIPIIDVTSFDITIILTAPRGQNRTTKFLNITLDGCHFIEQSFKNAVSLSGFLFQNIRKFVLNLPKKCPIEKYTEVVVSNLSINSNGLPVTLRQTRFDVTIILTTQSKAAVRVFVSGVVDSVSKKKFAEMF